ncbi:hypothetical protein CMV_023882 [Castanea mollissima]|uniref:Uncharacterized protein n=1 Tax=Castanea mollissima TaxID=60419 RepID=A0A8J4QP80_9ROSI|nr:hypothetical protein CMV_023882 [Castanea mollissima]
MDFFFKEKEAPPTKTTPLASLPNSLSLSTQPFSPRLWSFNTTPSRWLWMILMGLSLSRLLMPATALMERKAHWI